MSIEMIWAVSIFPEGVMIWLLPVRRAITSATPSTCRIFSAAAVSVTSAEIDASAMPYSVR